MPVEIGYFHPDKEDNDDLSTSWRIDHELMRRSAGRSWIEIYDGMAKVRDGEALSALEVGDTERVARLEAAADRLRVIVKALKEKFEAEPDTEYACLMVDDYESGVLADAERDWFDPVEL